MDGEMNSRVEDTEVETMASAGSLPRTRLDPRTGKQMLLQPASFWLDHEERRKASGQSIREYADAHGLALSTFRRWSRRATGAKRIRRSGAVAGQPERSTAAAFLSVPIRASSGEAGASALPMAQIEVQTPGGLRVCLYGEAADHAIDAVMTELRGAR